MDAHGGDGRCAPRFGGAGDEIGIDRDNRLVEGQLLAKRRDGLEARVKLLTEKTGVAARRP